LMGDEDSRDREWKMHPDTERIFVGTQDMVLSRLLMRGFAESRAGWPMSFGLLHAGVQFIFDEVQLMGPGLPTSLRVVPRTRNSHRILKRNSVCALGHKKAVATRTRVA
jgi:CRISPR-associated endonuclease/helicase Cas3